MHHFGRSLIPLAIMGVVIAMRFARMRGGNKLRVDQMWVIPALLLGATVVLFVVSPPRGWAWIGIIPALALGGGIGWWRGTQVRIVVDRRTGALTQQQSRTAMFIVLGLIAFRLLARTVLSRAGGAGVGSVTDIMVCFTLALLTAQRAEMYIRACKLLGQRPVWAR